MAESGGAGARRGKGGQSGLPLVWLCLSIEFPSRSDGIGRVEGKGGGHGAWGVPTGLHFLHSLAATNQQAASGEAGDWQAEVGSYKVIMPCCCNLLQYFFFFFFFSPYI